MIKRYLILIFLVAIMPNLIYAQTKENLEAINEVWNKFYQAFDSLDYRPMAEIHSQQLVRVSAGVSILDYETYINNYKSGFQNSKANNITNRISLRFFERVNNDDMASERGIYKLIINENRPDQQFYYGQFHVILKKENGIWKIVMDYDSNYENLIGEKDYLESHEIDDFQYYLRE